jgi:hypothetical protein
MTEAKASDPKASDSKPSASRATLDAQVNLTPVASQTFLVAVAVAGCISILCGTALILAGHDAGWILEGLAVLLICAALWAWLRSHSDVDLQTSAPTVLSLPNGAGITTDSRTLRDDGAVNALVRIFEANQRKLLPDADAIIENGMLVPNSGAAARARTEQINNEVQNQVKNLEVLVGEPQQGPTVLQHSSEEFAPDDSSAALNSSAASR